MALAAVLTDRARIIEKVPAAVRVEGTTPMAPVTGTWFRARLFLPATREETGVESSYRRIVKSPQLMYGLRDAEGNDVELEADQQVHVQSDRLGEDSVWRVLGGEIIAKKRSRIGYLVNLERVAEHQFVPLDE